MPMETATTKLEVILGRKGLAAVQGAHVLVFGVGGVGSNCVEALARGGVGRLSVVDGDEVQASNINRQAIAFASTVGRRKVDVMAAMIAQINPEALVAAYDRFVLPESLDALIADIEAEAGPIDYAVDAIDTVSTKLAIAAWAERTGTPLISSMGAANKLRPECLALADISETSMCPLCRVMRKEARKRGIERLRVLYSREEPVRPAADAEGGRAALGTASYMPPIMGQTIAGAVIRDLAGLA